MTEADLAGLRDEIRTRTLLPSFEDVERRARRRRRRLRLAGVLGVLGVLAVVLPALGIGGMVFAQTSNRSGLVVTFGAPGADSTGTGSGDGTGGTGQGPAPSGQTPSNTYQTLVAVDGLSTTQLYGLVDACVRGVCDLQLVTIEWDGRLGEVVFGNLLRSDPRDQLSEVAMTMINQRQVAVSGYINTEAQRTTITVGIPPGDAPTGDTMVLPWPVQLQPYNAIQVVSGAHQTLSPLTHQPPVRYPQLAATTGGWWVTGTDRATGRVAVSYSQDHGTTWRTSVLGVSNSGLDVELATRNGTDVYVLSTDSGQAYLTVSHNGGRTWGKPGPIANWIIGNRLGLYLPLANASVVAWTTANGEASYMDTDNGGRSWVGAYGPHNNGGVATIPGAGFIALGTDPETSTDGLNWTDATVLGING